MDSVELATNTVLRGGLKGVGGIFFVPLLLSIDGKSWESSDEISLRESCVDWFILLVGMIHVFFFSNGA